MDLIKEITNIGHYQKKKGSIFTQQKKFKN